MWTHERNTTRLHLPTISSISWVRHPHLSRLGTGLVVLGAADLTNHLWGTDVDWLVLVIGGAGAVWAAFTKRATTMLAGIVLAAVGFFAVLDDHAIFTHVDDALVLLLLAALILFMPGLPANWRVPWPIVPAGALLLVALLALLRLAADWAAAPWSVGAPILVTLLGVVLLLWDARGGPVP